MLIEQDKQEVTGWKLSTAWLISILGESIEKVDVKFSDQEVHLVTDTNVL